MRMIGILDSASPESRGEELTAFYCGLRKAGVNNLTVMVSYVWANNDYRQLSYLAGELVNQGADVIVAAGGPVAAIAAQKVTSTIPIVFTTVADPMRSGLVRAGRPGTNATGTWGFTTELEPDRMRVLDHLIEKPGKISVLANPRRPYPRQSNFDSQRTDLESAGLVLRRETVVEGAGTAAQIEEAFARLKLRKDVDQIVGLVVTADPLFNSMRKQIVEKVNELGIPAIYQWPSFVEAGGLMSYGPSKAEGYRNAGDLVGQILNDRKAPSDLPVRKTEDFDLVISKSRAAAFNIPIPSEWDGRPVKVVA